MIATERGGRRCPNLIPTRFCAIPAVRSTVLLDQHSLPLHLNLLHNNNPQQEQLKNIISMIDLTSKKYMTPLVILGGILPGD